MVVDVRGIKPRDDDGRKDLPENAGAALGDLVENEGGASEFYEEMAVPVDGSSTTSAGVIAAATLAT